MDKLANMQAFAVVAQTGSFAEASRRLNIANSVVSKRIKDLEDFLGIQLLTRTTRKVALTDTGYSYLEYARKFLDEMEEVESAIRDRTRKPVGAIKISAPVSFGMQYLGEALSTYMEKYPDVVVKTYLTDRRIDLVEEGYDLAIRLGPLNDLSLVAKKLADCRRVVCASPAYFKKHGWPKTPRDLKGHNCLSYLNLADGKAWPFMVDGKKIWQPVSGKFLSDNGDLLQQAALNGTGITFLPTFIVGEALKDGRLKVALEEYEEADFNVHAVYQHTRHLSIKVRTLIDHLSDCFGKNMATS